LGQKYYRNIDLTANQLLNSRLHNISTTDRVALGTTLSSISKGYMVYDTDLFSPYFWDGTAWKSAGGGTWGSITGTLTAQTDLTAYLASNYYPLSTNPASYLTATSAGALYYPLSSNPANYLTSSALTPYLTSATAASTYEPIISAGTASQYWRGDKTWQTFPTIPTVGTWGALNYPTWTSGTPFVKMNGAGSFTLDTNTYLTSAVTSIATSGLISGGPITNTGTISTSMATGKLVGRYSASTGVMEEITVGSGLTLTGAGTLNNTATPTPLGYYLSISDSTTQTNPTASIPRAVKFDTTDLANGFSLQTETAVFTGTINNGGAGAGTILTVTGITSGTLKVGMVLTGGSITAGTFISAFTSGTGGIGTYVVSVSQNRTSATYTGTMTSQIAVAYNGIYNLQFSSQMDKGDSGVDYVNFWLRRNGLDVSNSAGVISLQGNSPAYMMAAWNYVIELFSGDVIELYWASTDDLMEIKAETAQTSPFAHPGIQSTILTITQQSGIMAGSGINRSVNSVSTNTNAGSGANVDYVYLVSGTTTITLPTAVGNTNRYTIKRSGTGVVSIATTSSQTIDGSSSPININVRYVSIDLISNGANWEII
jgi:hypothetical protein